MLSTEIFNINDLSVSLEIYLCTCSSWSLIDETRKSSIKRISGEKKSEKISFRDSWCQISEKVFFFPWLNGSAISWQLSHPLLFSYSISRSMKFLEDGMRYKKVFIWFSVTEWNIWDRYILVHGIHIVQSLYIENIDHIKLVFVMRTRRLRAHWFEKKGTYSEHIASNLEDLSNVVNLIWAPSEEISIITLRIWPERRW